MRKIHLVRVMKKNHVLAYLALSPKNMAEYCLSTVKISSGLVLTDAETLVFKQRSLAWQICRTYCKNVNMTHRVWVSGLQKQKMPSFILVTADFLAL